MQFKRKRTATERTLVGRRLKGIIPAKELVGFTREDLLDLADMGYGFGMEGAATTGQNQTASNASYFPLAIVASTDQTINQGDLVWWDPVNYTLKPLTATNQVAVSSTGGFCGAAAGSNNPGVYPTPPSGQSENLPGIQVQRSGTVWLNATAADGAYVPFQPVTIGADSQTITRGGETTANRIGFVVVHAPVSPRGAPGATPAPETDASARVRVWLEPKFPSTVLA